jgi:hypothetical protein
VAFFHKPFLILAASVKTSSACCRDLLKSNSRQFILAPFKIAFGKIFRIQAALRKRRSEHAGVGGLRDFGRRISAVAFLAPDAILLVS